MTVRLNEAGVIVIEGKSAVEDAEILLEHLHKHPSATIDCSGCHFMHTAVVQRPINRSSRSICWQAICAIPTQSVDGRRRAGWANGTARSITCPPP